MPSIMAMATPMHNQCGVLRERLSEALGPVNLTLAVLHAV
jgi:hypothetical protein